MNRIPELSVDLIDELNKTYPDRCPDLSDTERDIWFNAGARAVVNALLERKARVKRRRVLTEEEPAYELPSDED